MQQDLVLVTYGSRLGGTADIADWIAEELRGAGWHAIARPAASVYDIERYRAVVVGGSLYAGHWHSDAQRFLRRHAKALRQRPVWLFSSGPLDCSAETAAIPPVRTVAHLAARIGARGHQTFGGRLEPDAKGFMAHAVAARSAGDHRDRAHVARWARSIADSLRAETVAATSGA
jgi:menaquinone-dependent protoporphyrinogen oxidase